MALLSNYRLIGLNPAFPKSVYRIRGWILYFLIIFLPLSLYAQATPESCINCHSDLMQQKVLHAAATDACDNCHLSTGVEHPGGEGKGFKLNEELPGLCFICHEDLTKEYIHAPAEMGECLMCHSPHSSPNKSLLIESPQSSLCAQCHDMGITERAVKHKPVEEGNCSSCHDPHQSDISRFLITKKPDLCLNCHATVKEEKTYAIQHPPFEDDCSNCHDPHSSNESRLLVEKSPDLCYLCHDNIQSTVQTATVPHPAVEDACSNCHSPHASKHTRLLIDEEKALCFTCHEEQTKQYIHPPADGECHLCHQPHGSVNPSLLANASQSALCSECHDISMTRKEFKHAPVEMGSCSDCHDPHQSDFSNFLKTSKPELCMECHDDIRQVKAYNNQHPPFEDECSNCHETHSADNKHLLAEKTPDLCYLCHDNLQSAIETAAVIHGVVTDEKGCGNCHSPHASNEYRLLLHNEQQLCLDCHSKTITVSTKGDSISSQGVAEVSEPKTRKIENIGKYFRKGNVIHGAIELAGCATCHDPHASDKALLLKGSFPEGLYAPANPDNFELCFTCHDASILTSVTSTATGFRNGDKNLHYVHINGTKGRSCRICHNVHGSPNMHLINDFILFGNWNMPLGYVPNENGGSCSTGCHAKKNYSR